MNKLFVLMGYPGSGKSTFLKSIEMKRNDLILSSDDLREELFGFRDQTHNKELFEELYNRAESHKDEGDVYIDSTCLTKKDRMRVFNRLSKFFEPHLICILRPIDELVAVNEGRKDTSSYIPEEIFKTILGRFQLPTYEEGWKQIAYTIITDKSDLSKCIFNYEVILDCPHDNPHHSETIKEHIDFCVNYCRYHEKALELVTLSKYHDLGKFYVRNYNSEKSYHQYLGHAALSAYIYLIDAVISYLDRYNNYHDIDYNMKKLFDIMLFDDITSILTMYYLIFYHDQPYTCPTYSSLEKSLYKKSKPLIYLEDSGSYILVEMIIDLLMEFNRIDRMRDEND